MLHLESEKVIHGADDDVDGGGAACLCAQVVLKICSKLQIIFISRNVLNVLIASMPFHCTLLT